MATLATVLSVLLWLREDRWRFCALPVLLVGMLSKESAVVAPALVVVVGLARRNRWRAVEFTPLVTWPFYFGARVAAIGLRMESHAPGQRVPEGGVRVLRYLLRLAFPSAQSANVQVDSPERWVAVASSLALLLGAVGAYRYRKKIGAVPILGGLWFAIALAPVSEFIPLGARFSDLLLHLPLVGVALVLASLDLRRVGPIVAVAVLLVSSGMTFVRVQIWHNDLSLWARSFELDPTNPSVVLNLATALNRNGYKDDGCKLLGNSIELLAGQEVTSVTVTSHFNLGICDQEKAAATEDPDGYRRALEQYQQAEALSGGGIPAGVCQTG